jgi:hypothetical protein
MNSSTELTICLNTAYSLLKDTVESDICSAHDPRANARPALPSYLDRIYSNLVRVIELERDLEDQILANDGGDQPY